MDMSMAIMVRTRMENNDVLIRGYAGMERIRLWGVRPEAVPVPLPYLLYYSSYILLPKSFLALSIAQLSYYHN